MEGYGYTITKMDNLSCFVKHIGFCFEESEAISVIDRLRLEELEGSKHVFVPHRTLFVNEDKIGNYVHLVSVGELHIPYVACHDYRFACDQAQRISRIEKEFTFVDFVPVLRK